MPMPAFLTLTGEEQGDIEGSCDIEDHEGAILIQALDHVVEIPTDSRGLPTGSRVHRPIKFTKEIDRSTSMLYQAMCTDELISEAEFKLYRLDGMGEQEHYYTILLENARITKVQPWIPNCLDKQYEGLRHMEDVYMSYEGITWTWEPDGIEYEDTWGGLL